MRNGYWFKRMNDLYFAIKGLGYKTEGLQYQSATQTYSIGSRVQFDMTRNEANRLIRMHKAKGINHA